MSSLEKTPAVRREIPAVYKAVRAVGTFRPKFNPSNGKIFSDELNVIGTAFWLSEFKVLITCAHVVQAILGLPLELAGLLVVGNAGKYRRAIIDQIDLRHDIAVLRLVDEENKFLSGMELQKESDDGLVIIDKYPNVSTEVSYSGFPLGEQLLNQIHASTYSEGVIGIQRRENEIRKEIQVSGAVVGGFSGSPVVMKGTDEVIGMLSNGPEKSANIFMAISWEHIKAAADLANS